MQCVSVFLNVAKFADFRWQTADDVSRTQGVCHVIHIFECSNEVSPNTSRYFWKHKVKVYSIFISVQCHER